MVGSAIVHLPPGSTIGGVGGASMDHTYKIVEITGSSRTSIEEAVNNAITRASKTLRELRWFEVAEIRGHLVNQQVEHYQVRLKLGFTLDETED
jgi:dodecin